MAPKKRKKKEEDFNQILVSESLKNCPKLYKSEILEEDDNDINIIDVDYEDTMIKNNKIFYYKTLIKNMCKLTRSIKNNRDWIYNE